MSQHSHHQPNSPAALPHIHAISGTFKVVSPPKGLQARGSVSGIIINQRNTEKECECLLPAIELRIKWGRWKLTTWAELHTKLLLGRAIVGMTFKF